MDATVTSNSTIELLNGDNNYFDENVSYFIIDSKTRKITVPKDFVTLGVEADADSERIWFECPRYVGDNVDLTTRNIYINYENANGEKDAYYSDDVVVDGDNIHFSWKIQKKVVRYKGNVKFIVCAMSTDAEGKKVADWNTTLCTGQVLEGLEVENPEPPAEEYDLINQLIDVTKNAISEVGTLATQSKEEIDELRLQSLADVDAEKTKSIEEVEATKEEALEYIGSGVDKSLTKENLAADAKATGDALLNLAIKPTEKGSLISLPDSAEAPIPSMRIFGKSEQLTTAGNNLCPNKAVTTTVNGVTFTVNKDKSVTVSGTASADVAFNFSGKTTIEPGTYYLSGCPTGGSKTTYYLHLRGYDIDTGDGKTITVDNVWSNNFEIVVKSGTTVSNLTFKPMFRLASITDNTYEPFTGGMPSPNPNYPQEIKSVGDDGSVEQFIKGKNLWDNANCSLGSTALTRTETGISFTRGTSTGGAIAYCKIPIYKGQTVTFSANGSAYSPDLVLYKDAPYGKVLKSGGKAMTYTAQEDFPSAIFALIINSTNGDCVFSNIQVEFGGTVTEFDSFKDAQALKLSTPNGLPGIPVSSGGNYTDENGQQWICDEIDLGRGVYVQRVRKMTMNSGDRITYSFSSSLNRGNLIVKPIDKYAKEQSVFAAMCNVAKNNPQPTQAIYGEYYINPVNFVFVGQTGASESEEHLREVFATLELLYVLETPIETPLTDEEIEAYKALHTNYPNTTIYNDDGAYTEVKYVADTKNYVDNKIATEVAKLNGEI